jgi:phenylalanyl-tRNA synthetase beta chain
MRISLDWISDFVSIAGLSPADIADRLTGSGIEATPLGKLLRSESLVIGEVISKERHPNADRLSLCSVTAGGAPLSVVCGAPNVEAGQKVVFAPVGTELADGTRLKKAKIRGVNSEGMICAEDEIGLGDKHEGIIVLPPDAPVGESLQRYLHLGGERLELELTPNRPDGMSHRGVARDLAALFDRPLVDPTTLPTESARPIESLTSITIDDAEGCPRYVARVVENVKIAPSPEWLTGRLRQVGVRPINNVVDVTNYVLMAIGHPMHAFDLDQLAGKRIVVRAAREGEKFTTLDGSERSIPTGSVFICDAERPVALGGIMGGLNSEITEKTTNILLEAAYFLPTRIRRTAKAVGLQTEASQRFERGADWDAAIQAVDWAAALIQEIAGGKVARGRIDAYPGKLEPATMPLRLAQIPRVLGADVPKSEVKRILTALGIPVEETGPDSISCVQPSWRPDLTREIDLVEEIARIWGFDRIPSSVRGVGVPPVAVPKELAILPRLRSWCIGLGLREVITSSLVPQKFIDLVKSKREPVVLANYSTADMSVLRTHVLPSLLDVARINRSRKIDGVAMFELAHVYGKEGDSSYAQHRQLTILLSGSNGRERWCDGGRLWDYYDLSGIAETLVQRCSLHTPEVVHYDGDEFVPGTGASLLVAGTGVGHLGQVREDLCEFFDLPASAYYCQFDVVGLAACEASVTRVAPLPRFPAVERDLALLVPESIETQALEQVIERTGGTLLERVFVFDVYRGPGVGDGDKSIAFRLNFRAADRTLTDQEVDDHVRQIVDAVRDKTGARLRE